jgi:translation elongation factor EF-Tu-like GTPase
MPVETFLISGRGTVVTGGGAGIVKVGDELEIVGSNPPENRVRA